MNHKIIERENEQASIEKLGAQRIIYTFAKKLFIIQFLVSVLLLVLLSFAQLLFPSIDFTLIIATFSIIATFTDHCLDVKINQLKEKAAKIQELFDTYVLQLSWNSILCLEKPEYSDVFNYAQKYNKGKDPSKLLNWYEPDINKVAEQTAKLICQKTNCNYDASIRKRYNLIILATSIITVSLICVFTMFSGFTLSKLVLTIIFPAVPILQWAIKNVNSNNQSVTTLLELNSIINENWQLAKQGTQVNDAILRQIQDGIYINRKSSPLIPDCIYDIMRNNLEKQTNYTVKQLVDEILNVK